MDLEKLKALNNPHVEAIIQEYAALCQPDRITVITDSSEDYSYVRKLSLKNKEESTLRMEGHAVHFDGMEDQGRDKEKTKVLLTPGQILSKHINTGDRKSSLGEMRDLLRGSMKGKEMLVAFFCLGPENSEFSRLAMQITDSAYVVHSETLLYRPGYEIFKNAGPDKFFHFVHSAGELENGISKNPDKKRIYIDVPGNRVFSVNVQYAGNSMGLKKLALRLSINQASKEDWLCEHMFVMGVRPNGKNRVSYFAGAFPSASGKTTTAMTPGHTIISDDISYFRASSGTMRGANAEQGIFGIVEGVNPTDDPLIYKTLTTPRELIFSNILVKDSKPFWLGMGEVPKEGVNYSGEWFEGKTDGKGAPIPLANKNARYTLRLQELENIDPRWNDPTGVPISAILYGGRDPDTLPPIVQSFNWAHGVFIGASIESETTAATLGKLGVKKHDPMANVDFLSIPLGEYLQNHLRFGVQLKNAPKIFAVNYFLKENDKLIGKKPDTKVWLAWMEGRVNDEYEAIQTPIGFIPKYGDLKNLFTEFLNENYSEEKYVKQFSIRLPALSSRLERIEKFYESESGIPDELHTQLHNQRQRLKDAQAKYGEGVLKPTDFLH